MELHQTYTLVQMRDENFRTKTLVFDRPLPAQPGQFVMAWLPGVGEKPFSVAGDEPLSLMVVAVGPFSEQLHRLQPGDQVWIRGPLGHGFHVPDAESPRRPSRQRLLLVGGGYGVAPLLFLARKAAAVAGTSACPGTSASPGSSASPSAVRGAASHRVEVCIGARTAADVLLADAFAQSGAVVRVATEDGSRGAKGLVTGVVEEAILEAMPDAVYGCGPVPMLSAVEVLCRAHGLPHQLSWEATMRCGMGLCGACEVEGHRSPGWLACTDGPVSSDPGE